ncbi:hypothetical protein ACFQ0T_41970 [Kitasatospora gansuensis]
MPPGQPYPAYPAPPLTQQPRRGNPVGAVALGLIVSFIVSAIYTGIIFATYRHQSESTRHALYLVHALLNGAAVGLLAGLVGRRSNGARIGAAVIAPLGAFFGFANSVPLVVAERGGAHAVEFLLKADPFFPAKTWWGSHYGTEWLSVLGLVVAALAAWSLAWFAYRNRH